MVGTKNSSHGDSNVTRAEAVRPYRSPDNQPVTFKVLGSTLDAHLGPCWKQCSLSFGFSFYF